MTSALTSAEETAVQHGRTTRVVGPRPGKNTRTHLTLIQIVKAVRGVVVWGLTPPSGHVGGFRRNAAQHPLDHRTQEV